MNLPPELEKQLVQRGTLPPGLQKRLQTCPEEFERRLPPPPPDCAQLVIGGHSCSAESQDQRGRRPCPLRDPP
jgi:hypothetical protein